jgi:hypothetical protein
MNGDWFKDLVYSREKVMSLGEDRVRVKFNPSDMGLVGMIKHKTAELIDLCEEHKARDYAPASNAEVNRLWSLAQTHFEDAAMWAVKAATSEK